MFPMVRSSERKKLKKKEQKQTKCGGCRRNKATRRTTPRTKPPTSQQKKHSRNEREREENTHTHARTHTHAHTHTKKATTSCFPRHPEWSNDSRPITASNYSLPLQTTHKNSHTSPRPSTGIGPGWSQPHSRRACARQTQRERERERERGRERARERERRKERHCKVMERDNSSRRDSRESFKDESCSLTLSLTPSLPHSLTPSRTHSLPLSLSLSLPLSHTLSLPASVTPLPPHRLLLALPALRFSVFTHTPLTPLHTPLSYSPPSLTFPQPPPTL